MLASEARVANTLMRPAAEEALRGYAAGRSSFDYGLARDLELLIQALRAAHEEAKAASQAKTAFLASVSHELRTPLNAIIGFAEMIASEQLGAISEKRYPCYAKDIVKGARRLTDILGDILDMARLEGGRMQVQREPLAVSDVVEEVCAQLRERLGPDSASLQTAISSQFPQVIWTDRRRIRQILVNLLSNAMAYTPADGSVMLSADVSTNGDAQIKINDSGCGMSPEELKRAVTRFGHVEDEVSRKNQGIGLGLPLAKSLTELMGGKMTVESSPGEGTAVTVSFPKGVICEQSFTWRKPPDRMAERARRLLGDQLTGPKGPDIG